MFAFTITSALTLLSFTQPPTQLTSEPLSRQVKWLSLADGHSVQSSFTLTPLIHGPILKAQRHISLYLRSTSLDFFSETCILECAMRDKRLRDSA